MAKKSKFSRSLRRFPYSSGPQRERGNFEDCSSVDESVRNRMETISLEPDERQSAGLHNEEKRIREVFNQMVDEYDHLSDLWCQYTFNSVDSVLLEEFKPPKGLTHRPVALDVGCGTGIQSLRLASMGYEVIGVDLADALVASAKNKLAKAGYHDTEFSIADAQHLPLGDSVADCVNCCGPTLSFIPDWRGALREIARCLRPGGKALFEVEGKWNLDLFWEILNALAFNFLGYNEPLPTALRHLRPPWNMGHSIEYEFPLESGESVQMPLRLFAASEFDRELAGMGLVPVKKWGLHVITNLIPSTILHNPNPSRLLSIIFKRLSSMERRINHMWPFTALGCSLLVVARKRNAEPDSQEE
jgi:ubiquinone/menaquinone biosynthesis C-methylase UbiE